MGNLDWHYDRSDLKPIKLIDLAPESDGINLQAVRRYRQQRVRSEMAKRNISAIILSDLKLDMQRARETCKCLRNETVLPVIWSTNSSYLFSNRLLG